MVGHVIQQHTQVRIVNIEPPARLQDHYSRLFFGRTVPPVVPGQPWYTWRQPAVTIDVEVIRQPVHDLSAYRQITIPAAPGQPWYLWSQPTITIGVENIRQPAHDLSPYRQITIPAVPGQPWYLWPHFVAKATPQEYIHCQDHDGALYPFRPHDAITPPEPPIVQPPDGLITGGWEPEYQRKLRRDYERKCLEEEQKSLLEQLALEHVITQKQAKTRDFCTPLRIEDIVSKKKLAAMTPESRAELRAKIESIYRRQRLLREDDEFMLM
jgi:hypothetical protein